MTGWEEKNRYGLQTKETSDFDKKRRRTQTANNLLGQ